MAEGKTPYQVLENYVDIIHDSLIKSLYSNDRYVKGGLAQSIEATVKVFGQNIILQVYMNDYWKFVDRGVSGTQVKRNTEYSFKKKNLDKKAMLKHIANRGERFSPMWEDIQKNYTNKKGLKVSRKKPLSAVKARNTLAFLIGRKIASQGIEATNFVDEGIDGIKVRLEKDLLEAVGRKIEIDIVVK